MIMVRTWLKKMSKDRQGKSSRHAVKTQPPRLLVEALEARELLSGGLAPGYYLGSGTTVYRHTPSGPQLVYNGTQQVVEMVAVGNGGVDTLFSGGGVYFSPDGNNIGGGGNTIRAYTGSQTIVRMIGAGGGVDTQFSGSSSRVYFSPDGQNLGGGGNTIYAYNGTQDVVQMVAAGGGVDTLFSGSSSRVYFSPDGKNIGGGGNTIYAYNGTQSIVQMVSAGGGVDTLFSGSSSRVYFSPDGRNIGGGGNTIYAYNGTQSVVQMVSAGASGGVDTIFSGSGSRVYFSPDGKNLGGGGSTIYGYNGSQTVVQMASCRTGVLTLFSGQSLYFSPDGQNIGGGGQTSVVDRLVYSFSLGANDAILINDWFGQSMQDPGLIALARTDYINDFAITRSEMLGLFANAESSGTVSAAQLQDLRTLVASSGLLSIPADVSNLASKVVNGDPANANYHYLDSSGNVITVALGNLAAGSSATQLTELVNKWFLGMNEPTSDSGHYYLAVGTNVPLTANGFNYYDVRQGQVGDCWLMASLAEVADRAPAYLQNMFTYDGTNMVNGVTVGVWTVRFFHNGVADYVTVDTELPDGGYWFDQIGHNNLDGTTSTETWVALAEKAYAQENESGWIGTSNQGVNSYAALDGGWPVWALPAITGGSFANCPAVTADNVSSAWNSQKMVALCTPGSPPSSMIVGNHCYALVGFDSSSSSPFTVFNPWGLKGNGYTYAESDLLSITGTFLSQNFDVATAGQAIAPSSGVLPGTLLNSLAQHASDVALQRAMPPTQASPEERLDALFATLEQHRDDSQVPHSATSGHSKHDSPGSDRLFLEANWDSCWER